MNSFLAFFFSVLSGLGIFLLGIPPAFPQTLDPEPFSSLIPEIVEEAIRTGQTPGAVILIGRRGNVVYRRSFGHRILLPEKRAMEPTTVFDIASMTKVVATTTAVLQLAERGKLNLDDPVAKYWPEFKARGKERITVRQILTHYSGLRPGIPLKGWSGYQAALARIRQEKPVCSPGTSFNYGDTNFAVLGEVVRRVSGKPLDVFCRENIFAPLGMNDTCFRPPPAAQDRLAATRISVHGIVHDPLAYKMGGVSGHAGLFSTADDLGIFARMVLDEGRAPDGRAVLNAATVKEMIRPQSPPGKMPLRGWGWDVHSPSGSEWSMSLPPGSCAHRGFTGTLIWIDPPSESYLIVLTNRIYPNNESHPETLRSQVLAAVIEGLGRAPEKPQPAPNPALDTGSGPASGGRPNVRTGIDILAAEDFTPLAGLRVGLITNHSGLDGAGRRTIDLLARAPGVKLKAIFSPEHGLTGQAEGKIAAGRDPATGLPVHSLYGETRTPTARMLEDIDALVFDIQDAGVRFYTYASTMAYALEAAAKKGISFYVLDRPNPITGSLVQGPIMDPDLKSFTGCFPMPIRHGMTLGEMSRMFNSENRTGARLHVIAMSGYRRTHWYDETGLKWINPSPNLRSLTQAILYPGAGLVEGANVSVGRGTGTPFELIGAPWIDARELGKYLNSRNIPGVRFEPVHFTPDSDSFKNQRCSGVRISLTDRQVLDGPALGIEMIDALFRLYPRKFQIEKTIGMVGARWVLQDVRAGRDPRSIAAKWQEPLASFLRLRSNYLLY